MTTILNQNISETFYYFYFYIDKYTRNYFYYILVSCICIFLNKFFFFIMGILLTKINNFYKTAPHTHTVVAAYSWFENLFV